MSVNEPKDTWNTNGDENLRCNFALWKTVGPTDIDRNVLINQLDL